MTLIPSSFSCVVVPVWFYSWDRLTPSEEGHYLVLPLPYWFITKPFISISNRFSQNSSLWLGSQLLSQDIHHILKPIAVPIWIYSWDRLIPSGEGSYLILCRPLLFLPSVFPSFRVFSSESALNIRWPKYWGFSFCIGPSSENSGLISFRIDWIQS